MAEVEYHCYSSHPNVQERDGVVAPGWEQCTTVVGGRPQFAWIESNVYQWVHDDWMKIAMSTTDLLRRAARGRVG